jgi:hypothetical protein
MILLKSGKDREKEKLLKQEKFDNKILGKTFVKFAWFPTQLRCGKIVWLEKYCLIHSKIETRSDGGQNYYNYSYIKLRIAINDYDAFIIEFPKYEKYDIVN